VVTVTSNSKRASASSKNGKSYSSIDELKRDYFPDMYRREHQSQENGDPKAAGKAAASEIVERVGALDISSHPQ
jgi:hypothetical protein